MMDVETARTLAFLLRSSADHFRKYAILKEQRIESMASLELGLNNLRVVMSTITGADIASPPREDVA